MVEAAVLDLAEWGLAVMVAFGYRVNPELDKCARQAAADVMRGAG